MKVSLVVASLAASALASVWPLPASYEKGESVLWIDESVKIQYKDGGGSVSTVLVLTG